MVVDTKHVAQRREQGEAQFSPDISVSTEQGLRSLRAAIERCQTENSRAEHPAFGKLTREEWDKLNLRHAELHMSYAVLAYDSVF